MRLLGFEQDLLRCHTLTILLTLTKAHVRPRPSPSSSQQPHLSNILAPTSQPANTERTESEVRTRNSAAGNKRLTLPAVQIQADDGDAEGEPGQKAGRRGSDKGKEKDKEDDKWIQGLIMRTNMCL